MTDTMDSSACAELLLCSSDQVEDLARAGEIPGVKFGRGWLFVRADMLAYLAERGRREAEERRSARAPNTPRPIRPVKPRRRAAPPLPAPH